MLRAPRPYEQIELRLTNLRYRLSSYQYIQSFATVIICENDLSDFESLLLNRVVCRYNNNKIHWFYTDSNPTF